MPVKDAELRRIVESMLLEKFGIVNFNRINGEVPTEKIVGLPEDIVGEDELAPDSVGPDQLQDDSVGPEAVQDGAILGPALALETAQVNLPANYAVGTSENDVTSLTYTTVVAGDFIATLTASFNFNAGDTPGATRVLLNVGGANQAGEIATTHQVSRVTCSRSWRLTGLAAATVIKARALKAAVGGVDLVADSTTLLVVQVG